MVLFVVFGVGSVLFALYFARRRRTRAVAPTADAAADN
jgi:hypothetical protein